jgi:hypothetical protein
VVACHSSYVTYLGSVPLCHQIVKILNAEKWGGGGASNASFIHRAILHSVFERQRLKILFRSFVDCSQLLIKIITLTHAFYLQRKSLLFYGDQ